MTLAAAFAAGIAAATVSFRLRKRFRRGIRSDLLAQLEKVIDSANEGIYVTDPQRRFVLWNEAAERITGYRKVEIVGRHCHDNVLCHADREGRELCFTHCPLNAAVDSGGAKGPEIIYLRHRDGRRIPVEVKTAPVRNDSGEVIGGVEIFEDVTVRLENERLLRERKEKLETVLDSIGDGILFLDGSGSISVANRACAELFGFGADVVGADIEQLGADVPLRQALQAAEERILSSLGRKGSNAKPLQCGRTTDRLRCWTVLSGDEVYAERERCRSCDVYRSVRLHLERPKQLTWKDRSYSVVSSFIELQETGDLWEAVVFRDVTAEKLDAVLNIAGAAAHELRQPLQVIMVVAGMLERSRTDVDQYTQQRDAILTSCRRMDKIIQQMSEITSYRTKDYVDGTKILDLHRSAKGS